jgi:hypothetical protein
MRTLQILLAMALFAGIFGLSACDEEEDGNVLTATITHGGGIDWSAGGPAASDNLMDGETISWCEIGTPQSGVTGLWYRTFTQNPNIYRLGNVSLSSVSSYDQALVSNDLCATPLAVGDVYVVECLDGYVAFKVTSVAPVTSQDWAVEVEYVFSTTVNF